MKKTGRGAVAFLRRNAVYFILSLCILAIGLSVSLMLVNRDNGLDNDLAIPPVNDDANLDNEQDASNTQKPDETPDQGAGKEEDPVIKVVSFIMPVANASEVGEYSETMVFNQTLSRFESHMAIDFYAQEGTSVLAVYDGTVESVTNTLLHGTTIVIDHGDGLKSIYNSLADGELVVSGQTVKQGDVIGEVSSTNRQEYKDGPHLHFVVEENGQVIDPAKYLTFNEK